MLDFDSELSDYSGKLETAPQNLEPDHGKN